MAKVQIAVTVTINPVASALTVDQTSVTLADETVGTAVTSVPIAKVSGGTPPYQQPTIDPSSAEGLPPGLTLAVDTAGNVTLSGTPTAAGTGTFLADVADSGA